MLGTALSRASADSFWGRYRKVAYTSAVVTKFTDTDQSCTVAFHRYFLSLLGLLYVCTLLYAPQRSHMAPETEVCLYPCGDATCAPMAVGVIPPESQLNWLSGKHLIMSF
jgi:hypothetical protein